MGSAGPSPANERGRPLTRTHSHESRQSRTPSERNTRAGEGYNIKDKTDENNYINGDPDIELDDPYRETLAAGTLK